MEILLLATEFDEATKYTFKWSKRVNAAYRLEKENAVREVFEHAVKTKDYDAVIFFSHGNWDRIYGNDERAVLTNKNINLMYGKKVCSIACRSAKELGRSDSPYNYIGFNDNFSFIVPYEKKFGDFVVNVSNCFYDSDWIYKMYDATDKAYDSVVGTDYITEKTMLKDISLLTGILNTYRGIRNINTFERRE